MKIIARFISLASLLCFAFNTFSQNTSRGPSNCQASNRPIVVMQTDRSTISIVGKGNMNQSWTETTDGYTIIPVNGIYEYAREQNGKLISTGLRAHDFGNRSLFETILLNKLQKSQKPAAIPLKGSVLDQARKLIRNKNFPTTGNIKVLALLIDYPDLQNTYSTADFDSLFNNPNHHNGDGSFASFYDSSSNGQLKITVDVYGWYRASNNSIYYSDSMGFNPSRELVREAVDAAELAGVDFSQYDNNSDGYVDGILAVHAGPGAEEGSQSQYVWSHRWVLGSQWVTYDNTTIYDYMINPETRGGIQKNLVGIGVFCHEFGHNLGLPDLYDTDISNGDSEGIGEFGLMGGGSWLGGEHQPCNLSAWSRIELGWENPKILNIGDSGFYSIKHSMNKNEIFKIPYSGNSSQYFLLENRQNIGLDIDLPGEGMAIWHINTLKTSLSAVNTDENNKGVDLEEADGDDDLDNAVNRGDYGDLYPGSSTSRSFNDNTYPNSKINFNNTGILISNIREYKEAIYFNWGPISSFLAVTEDTVELNYAVNSNTVFHIVSNIKWTASSDSSWLDVRLTADSANSTVPVYSLQNNLGNERFATIYIFDETDKLLDSVVIKQKGVTEFLLVDSLNISFGPDSVVSDSISVISNVNWTVASNPSWFTFNPSSASGNSEIVITTSINTSVFPRRDSLEISSTSNVPPLNIQLFQAGNMYLSTSSVQLNSDSASFGSFKAASIEAINISSPHPWIKISNTPLVGMPDSILVHVEAKSKNTSPSSRTGYVLVNDPWQEDTIWIAQATSAPYFQVTTDTVFIGKDQGSTGSFQLLTNSSWSLAESTSWLLCNPTFGSNSDSILLQASTKNNSGNPRSALVSISAPNFADIEVLVIQLPSEALLSVSTDSILLGSDSGDFKTFSISSNLISWEIEHQANWLSVSPDTGGFTQLIKVMAIDSNDSKSIRVENIQLKAPPFAPLLIKIMQDTLLPVGMQEHSLSEQIRLYPNPNNGSFYLEFAETTEENSSISIFNLIGEELSHFELDKLQGKIYVDLRTFNPGIYFLNIQRGDEKISRKISIIE